MHTTQLESIITQHHKRHTSASPSNSPHCLGKVGPKWKRTGTFAHNPTSWICSYEPASPLFNKELVSEAFWASEGQRGKHDMRKLERQVLAYSILKNFCTPTQLTQTKSSGHCGSFSCHYSTASWQCSLSFIYMNILNENTDSEETMSQEKIALSSQQSIVLVGDGKTHQHLKVKASIWEGHYLPWWLAYFEEFPASFNNIIKLQWLLGAKGKRWHIWNNASITRECTPS